MEELGRRLRAAREAKGITLQVAEDDTKIRRKYLEALEAGREVDLPGDAYTKGFLRTYGNYLELDGPKLVEEYKLAKLAKQPAADAPGTPRLGAEPVRREPVRREPEGLSAPAQAREPAPEPAPAERRPPRPERAERAEPRREATAQGSPRQSARPRPTAATAAPGRMPRGLGTVLLGVVLLGAITYLGVLIFRQTAPPEQPPDPTPPVVDVQPEPTPPPKLPDPPKVTMTRGSGQEVLFSVPADEITVVLEPNGERVWMQATIDGKVQKDQYPTGPVEFKGKQIVLRMGHMNNINLVVNGQRFEKPLQSGPYTITFSIAAQ